MTNTVQPIRNKNDLQNMYMVAIEHDRRNVLNTKHNHFQWYLLLLIGFNTALRVSDLLQLKAQDIRGEAVNVKARKTHKATRIVMNENARMEAIKALKDYSDDEYIFHGQYSENPVNRITAYRIIKSIADSAGVKCSVGCHSLRKTYAYWYYKESGDLATLQKILGHESRRDTLTYIGIADDEQDRMTKGFTACLPGWLDENGILYRRNKPNKPKHKTGKR